MSKASEVMNKIGKVEEKEDLSRFDGQSPDKVRYTSLGDLQITFGDEVIELRPNGNYIIK